MCSNRLPLTMVPGDTVAAAILIWCPKNQSLIIHINYKDESFLPIKAHYALTQSDKNADSPEALILMFLVLA